MIELRRPIIKEIFQTRIEKAKKAIKGQSRYSYLKKPIKIWIEPQIARRVAPNNTIFSKILFVYLPMNFLLLDIIIIAMDIAGNATA